MWLPNVSLKVYSEQMGKGLQGEPGRLLMIPTMVDLLPGDVAGCTPAKCISVLLRPCYALCLLQASDIPFTSVYLYCHLHPDFALLEFDPDLPCRWA